MSEPEAQQDQGVNDSSASTGEDRPRPIGVGPKPSKEKGESGDKPKGFWARQWKGWIRPVGMTILIVVLIRTWGVDWNDVPSASMEAKESVLTGDRVVVWKSAYDLRMPWPIPVFSELRKFDFVRYNGPNRGDVVTFWNPQTEIRMIKRVVAIPGDTVSMRRGELRIIDADGNAVPVSYQDITTDPKRKGPEKDRWHDYVEVIGGASHTIQRIEPIGEVSETRMPAIPGIGKISIQDSQLMLDGQEVEVDVWLEALFRAYQFAESMPTTNAAEISRRENVIGLLSHLQGLQLRTNFGPVELKNYPGNDDMDEYWCMGDNRDRSSDSRYFGVEMLRGRHNPSSIGLQRTFMFPSSADLMLPGQDRVTAHQITGKVFGIAWSLDSNWIPRIGRTFNAVD